MCEQHLEIQFLRCSSPNSKECRTCTSKPWDRYPFGHFIHLQCISAARQQIGSRSQRRPCPSTRPRFIHLPRRTVLTTHISIDNRIYNCLAAFLYLSKSAPAEGGNFCCAACLRLKDSCGPSDSPRSFGYAVS